MRVTAIPRTKWFAVHPGGRFDRKWRRFMASLKDGTGYGGSSQGSHEVEFLPLVGDVVGWIGLFVCAVGVLFLLGEGAAAVFGRYETTPVATDGR
jgi:hypothetical protein